MLHAPTQVIVYLSDVEAGGATHFPDATATPQAKNPVAGAETLLPWLGSAGDDTLRPSAELPGLSVMPRAGRAIAFWSALTDGSADPSSIHEAQAVTGGEKWIASRFFS